MSNLSPATGTWIIDPFHTTIDGDNLSASCAELTIEAASINTNSADRDAHLTSADFLDAENFPTLTFVSTAVAAKGDEILVTGDLTIHGVTNSVEVKYEFVGASTDPYGTNKVGFEGTAKISRKDFGLVWNTALETGGVLVGDEIHLTFDVEANKQ